MPSSDAQPCSLCDLSPREAEYAVVGHVVLEKETVGSGCKKLKKAPKMDVSLKETRVSLKEMHFSLKETRFTQGKIAKIAPKAPQEGGAPNSPYTQEKQVPPSGFFY